MYLVEVKGNVIIRGGDQRSCETVLQAGESVCQEQIEKMTDDYSPLSFNRKKRVVEGNLFLSEKRRYIPFATYLIHGDEIIDGRVDSGKSWVGDGVAASYKYWEEGLETMGKRVLAEIPFFCRDSFYNGLFVECFSALELLLCNIVFSLLYSKQVFFDRAVNYWSDKTEGPPRTNEELEWIIHDFFAKRVYHRFEEIDLMYFRVFGFNLPDFTELVGHIHKRNNIVHRHSVSNLDWMTITDASQEDVLALFACSELFAKDLRSRASEALRFDK